jgi:alpha-L-arabinofuranosidase
VSKASSAPNVCRLVVDRDFVVAEVDRRLCGSFVEHLGRVVYGGIYEPGHPAADEAGFRSDVRDLVEELGVSVVRYPGGNFVSAYDWQDGVGPRSDRPRRYDPAWRSVETNEFGVDEFMAWCRWSGTEPFLVFNLGTQGVESACRLVEYCNGPGGTAMSDWRGRNGHPEPYDVRLWGLGNEMDGNWQVGSRSAAEYGSVASQVSRAVKRVDSRAELVVAGSSLRNMTTFPEWDRTVLEQCYDSVDYLALHQYYPANVLDEQSFAASGADFEAYLAAGIATCDYVGELKRSRKRLGLSVDEWNVNYRGEDDFRPWQVGPPIAEFSYSPLDAVVVGSLLLPLLRHADRARIACQSLLVNVGGAIRAAGCETAVKEPTFGPLAAVFNAAPGRRALAVAVDGPEVATAAYGDVPVVDAAAVAGAAGGPVTVFAVNRSVSAGADLQVSLRGWLPVGARASGVAKDHGPGPGLSPLEARVTDKDTIGLRLPPLSWVALTVETAEP